jgi:hypothetical protein
MKTAINTISNFWQFVKKLPLFAFTSGLAFSHIAGSFLTFYTIAMMINPQPLKYEGWVQIRVIGFGSVAYEKNVGDYLTSIFGISGLSRSSSIITTIYTDAIPRTEVINSGEVMDSDVSVLTNLDWHGRLRGQTEEFKKINSQTFMSKLISSKEEKTCLCLYVAGNRNGKTSEYLNVLKVRDSIEGNDVAKACQATPGDQILKRVDHT